MEQYDRAAGRTASDSRDSVDASGDRPPISARMALAHSITVSAPAEKVWRFLENLETNYVRWHPVDHKAFAWTGGEPLSKGATLYSEQIMAGELVKYNAVIAESIPLEKVVMRFSFPVSLITDRIEWHLAGHGDATEFTAITHLKFGPLARTFFRKGIYRLIADHNRHVRVEGENLKRLLENEEKKEGEP